MDRQTQILVTMINTRAYLEECFTTAGSYCDVVPEKQFSGSPTVQGEACRVAARAQYLIDILECELSGVNQEECCKKAERDYCAAFDACPP